jgi:uncharacterized protein (TIGR02117 family)
MKKLLKFLGYTLLTLIALILFYLGAAWGLSRVTVTAESNTQPDITIYLKSGGIHTDIVVPVKTAGKDWSQHIRYKDTRSGDTTFNYVAFGWGDKGFYLETPTWNDLKASTAFKAAFWLSTSAMHTTYCKNPEENNRCVRLVISKEQYQRLITYIENSLQADSTGHPVAIGANVRYGNNDAFYEAKGRYSLFYTCNTWTNNALKASGQRACWWTPFDSGIFYQYGH